MEEKKKVGVGFGVMILKDGKVLLGRRHDDPTKASSLLNGAGTWTMPGGKLHFGETFEEGAKREVLEEAGIKLNRAEVLCVNQDMVETAHFITIGLLSDDFTGQPKVMEPDEITEWRWFDLNHLPSPLYFPSSKVLENYKQNRFYISGDVEPKTPVSLVGYEAALRAPLRQVTLVLLLRDNQILLAMKKRGFGMGRWNGVGGKPNAGETIEQAAIREAHEEVGVTPHNLKMVAVLSFYFPHIPTEKNFNQQVIVYTSRQWTGEPIETEEMKPQWFDFGQIPYSAMWPDDSYWLPKVLSGSFVNAAFMFGENDSVLDHRVTEIRPFKKRALDFFRLLAGKR